MPAKLDRCVRQVRAQLTSKWKKRNKGKTPSEKVQKKITSSAWAICRETLNLEQEEVTE